MALVAENPPANAGEVSGVGSFPGSGRPPGGGHGNPLPYPCLENPVDRGVWRATVHRVAKSQIRLEQLSMHTPQAGSPGQCVSFRVGGTLSSNLTVHAAGIYKRLNNHLVC